MGHIFSRLILTAACIPVLMGAANVASQMMAEPGVHHFSNLDAPLWTVNPVHIDRQTQSYDRVAADHAATVTQTVAAVHAPVTTPVAVLAAAQPEPVLAAAGDDGREWCRNRYSSYNPTDNSYQPYGGAARRACTPPASVASLTVAGADQPVQADGGDAHQTWCRQRYGSYDAADNSYRAFSGVKRQCASPYTQNGASPVALQASM